MLTSAEQKYGLRLARQTLNDAVTLSKARPLESYLAPEPPPSKLLERLPCFVSLHTHAHRLRGCVGCVATGDPLVENIHRLTQAAAFEDPRFAPVSPAELPGLHLEISVLSPVVPLPSFQAIEVGRHGLQVRAGGRHGLLLAQVATEYGWTREEFIVQTCLKAGLPPDAFSEYEWFYFEQINFSE